MTVPRQTPEYAAVLAAMLKRRRCNFDDLTGDTKLSKVVVSRQVNLMLSAGLIENDLTSFPINYVLVKGG